MSHLQLCHIFMVTAGGEITEVCLHSLHFFIRRYRDTNSQKINTCNYVLLYILYPKIQKCFCGNDKFFARTNKF